MLRNLFYNCCPLESAGDVWRDNVKMLCRYGSIFNGRRIVIVRTGAGMENPAAVIREFNKHGLLHVDYRLRPNDPVLHETADFIETWESLRSRDPEEITFYAHTKGVSRNKTLLRLSVKQWRDRMYHECLHDAAAVDAALSARPVAGCFTRLDKGGGGFADDPTRAWSRWHFSGTFYWVNHAALFSKDNWRYLGPTPTRFAVEDWLGAHFQLDEAHVFYGPLFSTNPYTWATGIYRCNRCGTEYEMPLQRDRRRKTHLRGCCKRLRLRSKPLRYPELANLITAPAR